MPVARTPLEPDVKAVVELLPPSAIFRKGNIYKILELMDLRRDHEAWEQNVRDDKSQERFELLHRQTAATRAYLLMLCLILLRACLWGLARAGLVSKIYYDRVTGNQNDSLNIIAGTLEAPPDEFKKQLDELDAERQRESYLALLDRLREKYGVTNHRTLAYIDAHLDASMAIGHKYALAEIQARRKRSEAERDAALFKNQITSIGALVSFGAFAKALFVALAIGVGFFFFSNLFQGSTTSKGLTGEEKMLAALLAALIALSLTIMRLFFNVRRMTKVERDTRRRGANARKIDFEERRRVAIETWMAIEDAYRVLTGQDVPADALESQRLRIDWLDSVIHDETLEEKRNSGTLKLRDRIRNFIDGGLGQGDVGDLF